MTILSIDNLAFLRLMQLADSALPVGSTAHSFGLETLVAEGSIDVERLEAFLREYIEEVGGFESVFCRSAYKLVAQDKIGDFATQWTALNAQLSAFKTARESRIASATLGRRLLQLMQNLESNPLLQRAIQSAKTDEVEIHYCMAFGLAGSLCGVDEEATVLAYLHQSLTSLVLACQRMMPLGQSQASSILWQLKPTLVETASRSAAAPLNVEDLTLFTPLPDLGSMRHATLTTRLFIS